MFRHCEEHSDAVIQDKLQLSGSAVGSSVIVPLPHAGEGVRRPGEGKNAAFTLAEVLITLGIIGVVAAMTIPNLIAKNQKRLVETRLKSTYSILSNAIRLSEEENGAGFSPDFEGSGWSSQKSKRIFSQYLLPYLKINFQYQDNDCVKLSESYSSSATSQKYTDSNGACYALMNGVSIIFFAGSNSDKNNRMIVRTIINPTKKRKIEGKDVFSFVFINGENGYYIGTYEFCDDENKLIQYCNMKASRINIGGGSWGRAGFCTELIKRSGWRIPADYPIKF